MAIFSKMPAGKPKAPVILAAQQSASIAPATVTISPLARMPTRAAVHTAVVVTPSPVVAEEPWRIVAREQHERNEAIAAAMHQADQVAKRTQLLRDFGPADAQSSVPIEPPPPSPPPPTPPGVSKIGSPPPRRPLPVAPPPPSSGLMSSRIGILPVSEGRPPMAPLPPRSPPATGRDD